MKFINPYTVKLSFKIRERWGVDMLNKIYGEYQKSTTRYISFERYLKQNLFI